MTAAIQPPDDRPSYALKLANESYEWYRKAAISSRRAHRVSIIAVQLFAASIPVAAAISPHNSLVPAILGAIIVVISGIRSTFRWQENYLRFSKAREALEAERRLYNTGASPYSDVEDKDLTLTAKITRIEQEEMNEWFDVARDKVSQLRAKGLSGFAG